MQHVSKGQAALRAYHAYLQSDHDYKVWAEVLTMEEKETDEVDILDGQVNFSTGDDGPDRTASVVLSDPEGALSFGTSFAEDPEGTIWVNRLLRVKHEVEVPKLGPRKVTQTLTNRVLDPTAESGIFQAQLSAAVAQYPITYDSGVRHTGSTSIRTDRTTTSPSNNVGIVNMTTTVFSNVTKLTVTPGEVISGAAYVRCLIPNARGRLSIAYRDAANGVITPTSVGPLINLATDGSWNLVVAEGFTVPAGAVFAVVQPAAFLPAGGTTVSGEQAWFDSASLNSGSSAQPFFYGNTQNKPPFEYRWTGTPHQSTSLREKVAPTTDTFTTTCIVGVPTAVARQGAEISIELGDKSLLADHGVRPRTYKKGANVRSALVSILRDLTGEQKFRIPTTRRKLSRPYTVGMGEDALTPWQAFKRIAGVEMGWRAYYSGDGYATCEPTSAHKPDVEVAWVLALPDSSTSFTDFINYVKVTSRRKLKNKRRPNTKAGKKMPARPEVTIVYESVVGLPRRHRLSEQSLSRNGVPRTLPLVVDNDNLKTGRAVAAFAQAELRAGSSVDDEQSLEVMPFFHLDKGDKLTLPMGIGKVAFDECSIPLGVGGNMTVGQVKWVSRTVKIRRLRSKMTRHVKRAKGGKKHKHHG